MLLLLDLVLVGPLLSVPEASSVPNDEGNDGDEGDHPSVTCPVQILAIDPLDNSLTIIPIGMQEKPRSGVPDFLIDLLLFRVFP